jgi:hypothetical protein
MERFTISPDSELAKEYGEFIAAHGYQNRFRIPFISFRDHRTMAGP